MNSGVNGNLVDRSKIFEAILSSPGMQQACKIVLNPTRQTILVLARLIENCLENKAEEQQDEMIFFLPETSLSELKSISEEVLKKGGLVDFYQHLKRL